MSRRDRQGCSYDAYVPDPLDGWELGLPADLVADLSDAEAAVRRLNDTGTRHVSLEGLARFLLRAESVASSKIEGLDAGPRRLLDAEVVLAQGGDAADRLAFEVLANVAAMEAAVHVGSSAETITLEDLLEVHRLLLSATAPATGGAVRDVQNWIGGSNYNPCVASFVPPPPEAVGALLDDLLAYVNAEHHPPLVQAAVAHAQFETIHPFADGNGRTGRALIHIVLRRRGVVEQFVPPISLVLATWASDYVAGLTAYRFVGPPKRSARSVAAATWLRTFAAAVHRSCIDAERYAAWIDALEVRWREQLGRVRANSAADLLLRALPGAPVVTVESAARLIGRSTMRTGQAVGRLAEAGILVQRNVGRQRYRVFEATAVVDLFTGLERTLAGPSGDTAVAPPIRRVPRRPNANRS
ncbi:Fic family protein [Desertimonas flava]|uniref:Fic family protein n=1 Tax=Desertimonas flava TaxID=2064846 RepID=UPI0019691892|nr:Fic family protein [Desertimonas flava]